MSKFAVPVIKIDSIFEIPGANLIEGAKIFSYQVVVPRGKYKVGDLVAYIPEASIVPENILEDLGLTGRLCGKKKNRVKASKFLNCVSQGLIYPASPDWTEGMDVTEILNITKYEPEIPPNFNGEVYSPGIENTIHFDIENNKKYGNLFIPDEEVIFTEKIHGTFTAFGILPESESSPNHVFSRFVVYSKGLGCSKGLCFKDSPANIGNVYLKSFKLNKVNEKLMSVFGNEADPVFILGETYGSGIQDLSYSNTNDLFFRVFAIVKGDRYNHRYLSEDELNDALIKLKIPRVPVLYRGPYSLASVAEYTQGQETISGSKLHIREGIIITPVIERVCPEIGRLSLKSVSNEYLLRKGHTTEFK